MMKLLVCLLSMFMFGVRAQTNSHPGGGLPTDPSTEQINCVESFKKIDLLEKKFVQDMNMKYVDNKSFFNLVDVLALKLAVQKTGHGSVCSPEQKESLKKILAMYEESISCSGGADIRSRYIPIIKNLIRNYE